MKVPSSPNLEKCRFYPKFLLKIRKDDKIIFYDSFSDINPDKIHIFENYFSKVHDSLMANSDKKIGVTKRAFKNVK